MELPDEFQRMGYSVRDDEDFVYVAYKGKVVATLSVLAALQYAPRDIVLEAVKADAAKRGGGPDLPNPLLDTFAS